MIIAFAGKMGSGKDAAAGFLKEKGFERIAFADNLKEMAMEIFGLTRDQCYDQDLKKAEFETPLRVLAGDIGSIMDYAKKKNGFEIDGEAALKLLSTTGVDLISPREVLQYLGTEILRNCIDEHYHAKVVKNIIDMRGWTNVAIPDCRFPNERMFVKEWGGLNVLIKRPAELIENTAGIEAHASETSLGDESEYDIVIENDTTLAALKENVLALIER